MLQLDPWNKVAVMAGGACAVALTILLVICFVGDGCLVYEQLRRRKDKKDKTSRMSGALYGSSEKSSVSLTSYSGPEPTHGKTGQVSSGMERSEHSLVSRLSSVSSARSRQDSTYSSMSSGRTSPSSVRSGCHAPSSDSPPSPPPPTTPPIVSPPAVTFSLLATHIMDGNNIKLAIAVESATDLPSRDYGAHCDPWVSVVVLKDRRSLRRRPPTPLAYFRTKTIRHAHNPFYSQTFVADILKTDMKDVSVRLTLVDQDRHSGPLELGSTTVTMKEAKQVGPDPEKFQATQIIVPAKKDVGEILFGLSYLPTAQRLSFTITKVTHIKVEKEEKNEDDTINPYVRILMFNQSGRLIKKKKTTVKINTKEPVFNETLNFELANNQLENCRFLVTVCLKRKVVDMVVMEANQDSSDQEFSCPDRFILTNEKGRRESYGKQKDDCIGRIALGKYVRGVKERDHYMSVIETPRKVFSVCHSLK